MLGSSLPIKAAILGLGLLIAANVQAQSTVTGQGEKKTVTGSTAGPVNPTLDGPLQPTRPSGIVPMRDLLNYRVMAENGEFGRVTDIVLDRNGRMQYLLVTHQGQTYPMPFLSTAFSNTPNTLTYNVPTTTLEQLAINPQNLPPLTNQQFVERMRQVFGPSFAATVTPSRTNYPATGVEPRATDRVGTGPTMTRDPNRPPGTRPTGGSLNVGGSGRGVGGTGVGGPGTSGSGTGRSGTGEPSPGAGISGTGAGTSAAGKLQGAATGGAPGSTGGTSGSAGGAPDRSTGTGTPKTTETLPPPKSGSSGTSGSGS